jgi:formylglycine-generating enzyme required for sulfatase activity
MGAAGAVRLRDARELQVGAIAQVASGGAPGNEERCLKQIDTFKDCAERPEMVVAPAGSFMVGSPKTEEGRFQWEDSHHEVAIARPFAVGRSAVREVSSQPSCERRTMTEMLDDPR